MKGSRCALVTFKQARATWSRASVSGSGAGEMYKIREEHESPVEDPVEMAKVFAAMGLVPWFRYEKYRSTFRLPGVAGCRSGTG